MDGQHNHTKEVDKTMWLSDSSGSRTPEEGSDSTPHTPPSPVAIPVPHQLPVVEPHITISPVSSPTPSPQKGNRSPKRVTTPKSRLGAIDEHTDKVSPDVPVRDPRRLLGTSSRFFSLAFPPTLHSSRRPPKRLWDDVEGPNGEKFADLRNNKKTTIVGRGGWRRWLCLGLIALAIGLIIAIILLAVLLTRHKNGNSSNSGANDVSNPASSTFPAGTYKISSYLTSQSTSCTSNSGTWTCYPSETHTQDSTIPPSNLTWAISRTSDSKGWLITSQDTTFNYPFTNTPLTLENKGADNEAYVFNYTYSKPTFPTSQISTTNVRTRCYFNNTVLTGRLFTKMAKQSTFQENGGNQWPYALEFQESIASGTNVPDCYEYVNAQNGDHIDVATGAAGGQCECGYSNYNL